MHSSANSQLHYLWYYLWIAPHVLQTAVLWFMLQRQLHRRFPLFFIYTASQVLQSAVLVAISSSSLGFGSVYHETFAGFLAVSTVVRFAVIHEILAHVFERYPTVENPGRFFFRFSTVILLIAAVVIAILIPETKSDFLLSATYSLDRAVSTLQCGSLVALFVFSRYFALSWNSLDFGIALGLGLFASVELATSAVWLHLGRYGNTTLNLFTMGTYHCCVLVWLFYVLKPERVTHQVPEDLPAHDLESWNHELQRLVRS